LIAPRRIPTNSQLVITKERVPEAERSKVKVCGRSVDVIAGSNAVGGRNVCLLCAL
jgi:hypothetical protein